jgi:micrococcal nuclease
MLGLAFLVLPAAIFFVNSKGGLDAILPGVFGSPEAGYGKVVRVVDGDTLEIRTQGRLETVRLIGIDTPESVRPGVEPECGSARASAMMRRLAEGDEVRLIGDPSQDERDSYGRLLAYVFPTRSEVSYQERLLTAGLADVYVFEREFELLERFERASQEAERHGRGVFGRCGGNFHAASP